MKNLLSLQLFVAQVPAKAPVDEELAVLSRCG